MQNQHDRGRRDGEFFLSTPTEVENELPFQLVGAGCDFYQYPIDRPFGFPVYQWIQTIRGSGVLETGGVEYSVGEGEGMLLYPDEAHEYHGVDEPWYVHWLTFSGHHIERMLHYIGMDRTNVYRVSEPRMIESLIRKALVTLQSDYPLRGIDGSGVVYQLLLDFLKYYQRDGGESHDRRMMRLKPALDLIEAEMHRPLSIDDLAASIRVTPQYFCEIFKHLTSHRPTEYINQRRVERARQYLLREPQSRVSDIARRVGFESDSYFATVFKRFEGVSPTQYREINASRLMV